MCADNLVSKSYEVRFYPYRTKHQRGMNENEYNQCFAQYGHSCLRCSWWSVVQNLIGLNFVKVLLSLAGIKLFFTSSLLQLLQQFNERRLELFLTKTNFCWCLNSQLREFIAVKYKFELFLFVWPIIVFKLLLLFRSIGLILNLPI